MPHIPRDFRQPPPTTKHPDPHEPPHNDSHGRLSLFPKPVDPRTYEGLNVYEIVRRLRGLA